TIPYGFADACGIASSENHPSKFPRKLAWEVEERARGKHANPKELCENPNIYYRTIKKSIHLKDAFAYYRRTISGSVNWMTVSKNTFAPRAKSSVEAVSSGA